MTALASIALLTHSGAAGGVEGSLGQAAELRSEQEVRPAAAPERKGCRAHRALAYYRERERLWRTKMGAAVVAHRPPPPRGCPRYLARVARMRARAARLRYERWWHYHYAWREWLPDKWQRIGACETGYGRRPGNWRWDSGTYQGAFGFYHGTWDQYKTYADPKAGPYPAEAYLATPRQQYEVALAVWRRHGYSAWGCGGA